MRGQKTGLFLDQRENREAAARYARGRLLDCFSYNGGFALQLARQCTSVEARGYFCRCRGADRANAERNGVPHLQAREANVFDELRRLERAGERYDTIVLDPPAFAKNKASVPNALAGYKEINLRAMRLLTPGGYLITCSCSYNVNEEMFARRAAGGGGRQPGAHDHRREAIAGTRSPGARRRARDALSQVLHAAPYRVTAAGLLEASHRAMPAAAVARTTIEP